MKKLRIFCWKYPVAMPLIFVAAWGFLFFALLGIGHYIGG